MSKNPNDLAGNLNDTIASAVKAQISAAVLAALSGDEVMGRMVETALLRPVEIKDGNSYRSVTMPYGQKVIEDAIQEATKLAVAEHMAEILPELKAALKKAIRRNLDPIAEALTNDIVAQSGKTYGVKVDLHMRWPNQ